MVRATERVSHGWIDTRAVWASPQTEWWHSIWMAVSCCCGMRGPAESVKLPAPEPRLPG